MRKIYILIFIFFNFSAFAQEPSLYWLKVYEGSCVLTPYVSKQNDGGFVLSVEAGLNYGNIDSLCSLTVDRTIFLKYNADASILEWTKCYAGNFSDSGFLYLFSTPDGGSILGGIGNRDTHTFLIHKEDASGTLLWSKSYGDSAEAVLESMVATDDGGYIMFGQINYSNNDFPIHYGSFGNVNLALIKIDSNGNKVWSKVIGGSGGQTASSVVLAPNGGCYIVGSTNSNDHDCTGNHGDSDAYLARLDSAGNILWHSDLGGSNNDGGTGTYAYTDNKGGVIIATVSTSTDGDVTHQINPGGFNIWVLDVDSGNHILWNNCYGGEGQEYPNSVCKATDGSIWVAGTIAAKGGEIDTAYGGEDSWFVHADSVGNFIAAKVLGSHKQDEGMMVYPLSNGNVIAGGYYDTTGGCFPFISWPGGGAFLTVFTPETVGVPEINIKKNAFKMYPNPADKEVIISMDQGSSYDLLITDVVGKVMYRTIVNNKIQVQIEGWPTGLYYVQMVSSDGYRAVQKLIVE
jgi:hypothetical protein